MSKRDQRAGTADDEEQRLLKMVDRANALAEAGDFAAATALFRSITEESALAEFYEPLAQCLLELDDPAAAMEAANAAVHADPTWASAWLTFGRASLNAGQFAQASEALRRAVALEPDLSRETDEDIATADRLQIEQDERTMIIGGASIVLQQWRHAEGADLNSCSQCVAASAGEARGTGTMIWEAGIVLAMYLEHDARQPTPSHSVRDQRVIELGSGTGVSGLAAAALGAQVTLTDAAHVVPHLQSNVEKNSAALAAAGGRATVVVLDWEMGAHLAQLPACETVLGADLLYQREGRQLPALAVVLKQLLTPTPAQPAGGRLLLAHKSRHDVLDLAMLDALGRVGIDLAAVPFADLHPEYRSPSITLYCGRMSNARDPSSTAEANDAT